MALVAFGICGLSEGSVATEYPQGIPELAKILEEGGGVYVHCSAGIHRRGMIVYGLVRSGVSRYWKEKSLGQTQVHYSKQWRRGRPDLGQSVCRQQA